MSVDISTKKILGNILQRYTVHVLDIGKKPKNNKEARLKKDKILYQKNKILNQITEIFKNKYETLQR